MGALISILTGFAPILANLAGGSLAKTVVEQIAKVLGTPSTEEAILNAITENPEVAKARIEAIEKSYEVAMAEVEAARQNMEAFYRAAEADRERGWFFSWARPASAWAALWYFVVVTLIMARDLWNGTYAIFEHMNSLLMWGGLIMTLAGIWFFNRTSERNMVATSILGGGSAAGAGGPIADLIKATIGKFAKK